MLIREIEKALIAKGYKLTFVNNNFADDETRLLELSSNNLELPLISEQKNTKTYLLNKTSKTIYYFENTDNEFEIQEYITKGFKYLKNGELKKINKTIYKVLLNGENYTLKNFRVFLGII